MESGCRDCLFCAQVLVSMSKVVTFVTKDLVNVLIQCSFQFHSSAQFSKNIAMFPKGNSGQ